MAASHALLLDLDGVVFRHPAAFARIHARVTKFVATRVPNTCAHMEVHEALYRSHGHTLLGLRDTLGDTSTIAEFNRFVFDAAFIEEVRRIPRPNETELHSAAVRRLVAFATQRHVDVYIFTNAPRNWVNYALSTTGLASTFEPQRVLVGEELGYLKPQHEAYAAVEERVRAARITFVDDSLINLVSAPPNAERWCPVLFDPKGTHACRHVAHDLDDVRKLLL